MDVFKSYISYMKWYDTVDGRNPAPVDRLFTRCYTSQVVQDFFHQQYGIFSLYLHSGKRTWQWETQFFAVFLSGIIELEYTNKNNQGNFS